MGAPKTQDTYTLHGRIMGDAAFLLHGHFDDEGNFTGNFSDWEKLAGKLTDLWFGPDAASPVKTPKTPTYIPDLHRPGVLHVVSQPSESDIAEWKTSAMKGEATSSEAPVQISPLLTPDHRPYVEVDNTPPKVPNPMRKSQLIAEKKLQQQFKKKMEPKVANPDAGQGDSDCKKPKAKTSKAKSDGKSAKTKKRKPNDGPMKVAMDSFIKDGKKRGWNHAKCLRKWKTSQERLDIVNRLPAAERKRRRF